MLKSLLNFFRKYVLKNLPFKLVSLAIAIMLWWAVGRDSAIEIPMTVPLEFQHAPEQPGDHLRLSFSGASHGAGT